MTWEFAVGLLFIGFLLFMIGMAGAWLYDRVSDSRFAASVTWALAVAGLFVFFITRG